MVTTGLQNAAPAGLVSGIKIAVVEAFRLKLPYKKAVAFHSVTEVGGQYVILRLALADGSEGVAEAVCRVAMSGEDAASVADRNPASTLPRNQKARPPRLQQQEKRLVAKLPLPFPTSGSQLDALRLCCLPLPSIQLYILSAHSTLCIDFKNKYV